ncbi:hypothetical protein PHYC_00209 [Phycisphaerales bacterium]|nr:hypothetical protein PHYC_00209 [Phycisphaerales bacterium]
MAKASDILNKSGSSGLSPLGAPKDVLDLNATPRKDLSKGESIATHKPDSGPTLHGPGKAQGGGGGSAARPKV